MDRTKEYSFVLSTMPRLHARSRLLELGVCRCHNLSKISAVRRYSLNINVYTYDFKTFGPVPLGLNSRSET